MARRARYLRGFGDKKPGPWAKIDGGHPLARGLASAWLFNDARPGQTHDLVTGTGWTPNSGYAAGFGNAPTVAAGPFGAPAFHWRGASDNGISPDSNTPFQQTSITVLAWARRTASQQSTIFSTCFQSGASKGWAFGISDSSANVVKWYTANGSTTDTRSSSFALANNTWYQCVGTFDDASGAKKLYVDGKQEDSTTWSNHIEYSGTTAVFGALVPTGTNQVYTGDLDHFLVWNRALSAAEVQLLYAQPFAFVAQPSAARTFFLASQDVSPSAPAGGLTLTAPAPSDSTGDTLTAPAAGGTWGAPVGTSVAGDTAVAPAAAAVWAAPAPGLGLSRSVLADFLVGSAYWDAPAPAAAAGWSASARWALAVWDAPAPALAGGAAAVAPAAGAALNAPPPAAGTSTGTLADFLVGAAYWDAPAPLPPEPAAPDPPGPGGGCLMLLGVGR
jgi:Concanavalin A-like lectin/glucanases superfamily